MIYVDNAATTPLKKEVLNEMMPYLTEHYGNPSSIYTLGRNAAKILLDAREKAAKILGVLPNEIYFTGSGSEADNWAIKGICESYKNKGKHIITSAIEHHAVLHTFSYLEKQGYTVTYLPVDEEGLVSVKDFEEAITPDTIFASIMTANNEIGTIQPIAELSEVAHKHNIIFHTDAVQAFGHMPFDIKEMGVDSASISAHKFGGPKGVGLLYLKRGVKIENLIHGGGQERGRRAATENVAGIVGMVCAMEIAIENLSEKIEKMTKLRDYCIERISKEIPYVRLNGDAKRRLAGNVNFSFSYIEGEALLLMLDGKGIAASSGSACTSGSLDPSHVLLSIGLKHETAHGSLRLSFTEDNTKEEVDYIVDSLQEVVARLRDMSPLYEEIKGVK